MKKEYNIDAIVGVCITSAMYRVGWCPDSDPCEVENANGWSEIISTAEDYLVWIGIKDIKLSRDEILDAVWGMDLDEFNDLGC